MGADRGTTGQRGPVGGTRAQVLAHVLSEMERALQKKDATDEDGNVYCLVDRFVILQGRELLAHYQKSLEKAGDEAVDQIAGKVGGPADGEKRIL